MTLRRVLPHLLALAVGLLPPAADAKEAPQPLRCGVGAQGEDRVGAVVFPEGDVFCTLIADPKAVRSYLSYQRRRLPDATGATGIGSVGIADGVGLVRWRGARPGDGLQIGLDAGVFAQFDLGGRSADLLNADYGFGVPITFRAGIVSARVRPYHQSSHLGDELLHRSPIPNEGLSYEAIDAVGSLELGALRLYGGGEWNLGGRPSALALFLAHAGAEARLGPVRGARLVAAADLKASAERGWRPAWSIRAGVELARWSSAARSPRILSVLGEYYAGPSPYGQFFVDDTQFVAVGLHFQR